MSNSSPPFPVFTTYTYRTQRFTIIFLAQKETSKQTNLALLLRCTQTQKKSWVKKLSRLEKLLSSSWHLFFKVNNIRVHGQSVSIRYLKLPNNSFHFFVLIRMSFFLVTYTDPVSWPSKAMWRRSKRRTTMAKSETTTTMLTITAGMTISENQAAESEGTRVLIRWEEPRWTKPSLEANKVWIVELPWRLQRKKS